MTAQFSIVASVAGVSWKHIRNCYVATVICTLTDSSAGAVGHVFTCKLSKSLWLWTELVAFISCSGAVHLWGKHYKWKSLCCWAAPCCLRLMWNMDGSLEVGEKKEHASVTVKESRLFSVHFRDVLRCRDSGLLSKTSGYVCVRADVLSPCAHWTHGEPSGPHACACVLNISDQPLHGVTWESNQCLVHSSCFLLFYLYETRVSVTSWSHFAAADLSVFVHRAIFTYDGFTNKLKLADSGGKEDCDLLVAFGEYCKKFAFVVKVSYHAPFAHVPTLL